MKEITTSARCVVSGPDNLRALVTQALQRAGLEITDDLDHGLPSYADPITAHAAGAPNSGHTPGTEHPETLQFIVRVGDHDDVVWCTGDCTHIGQSEARCNPLEQYHGDPYVDDPSIAFLTVLDADPADVADVIAEHGWALRLHAVAGLETVSEVDLSIAARLERIEAALELPPMEASQ